MSLEAAANLFSADMNGVSPAPAAAPRGAPVDNAPPSRFGDQEMEQGEGGNGEEEGGGYDEGGDFAEEQAARRPAPRKNEGQPRDDNTGRFLKNEGPIDDGESGEEGNGAGEEGEGEAEAAEPTGRAADIDPETKVVVKIDGQEREVTFKEATEGYIRTQTFHQRMTALDNERQEVGRAKAVYADTLQRSQQGLEDILRELKAVEPAEPNWDELYRSNPNEAARQKVLWDRYNDGKKQLQTQHENILKQRHEENVRNFQEHVSKEQEKVLTKYPHWRDPAARSRDQAAIKKTLAGAGFTEQEINSLIDSRMVEIAMKAARFDRLSSQGIRPNRSTTRPMPSGSGASQRRSGPSNGNRALRDHADRQTVESATGAMMSILAQEG